MKLFMTILLCLLGTVGASAQHFNTSFTDHTLRVDYLFTGDASHPSVVLDELCRLPGWAGRRHHLDSVPLAGNGQITVRDAQSRRCLYRTSFSSLFQEWLSTDEAQHTARGFENSFLLPFPKNTVEIEVTLFNARRDTLTTYRHTVRPDDILIHRRGESRLTPHRYLLQNGDASRCIDVAILAEGYTEEESELFYADARKACESIFSHEPFRSEQAKFNVVAVAAPSADSGVSVPRTNTWKQTAVHSHFDTFYSERYLTTSRVKSIHNALAGIPYEHIIILANTDVYGGGGIYNSYTLTTAHHPLFKPVVVHEFGHSFGGLADEYFYEEDVMNGVYPLDVEPWEPNITTLVRFEDKWKNLLPEGTPVPTPATQKDNLPIGVFEGGGYSFKGIYRPAFNCRMRTNEHPVFCPACQQALRRMITFYYNTAEPTR